MDEDFLDRFFFDDFNPLNIPNIYEDIGISDFNESSNMETLASIDKTQTLSDAEYIGLGEKAARDVMQLFDDKQNWTLTNSGDNSCTVNTRKSDIMDAKECMLMFQTELDLVPEKLEISLSQRVQLRHRRHICNFCNAGFLSNSDLERHMPRHTGQRFICDTCDKSYTSKQRLTEHFRNPSSCWLDSSMLSYVKDVNNLDSKNLS